MTDPNANRLCEAFHDLPTSAFPFTLVFVADRTGRTVHHIRVKGPGLIEIPALAPKHGPITVHIR